MKLVTLHEAADILGIDDAALARLVHRGRLEVVLLDGEPRLRYRDVLDLLRPLGTRSA